MCSYEHKYILCVAMNTNKIKVWKDVECMKLFSITMDAQFDSEEDRVWCENKYRLSICNVTRFYAEDYERKNEGKKYCGPSVYVFVGSIIDLYEYFRYAYYVDGSEEEFKECMEGMRVCEI